MTNFDPFAPAPSTSGGGGEADQEKALLESYGFRDLLGGKWLDERGQVVTTSQALNEVYSRNYVTAAPSTGYPTTSGSAGTTGAAAGPSRTNTAAFTQGGVRYVYDAASGGFVPALGATSASGGTSAAPDPNADLRRQQLQMSIDSAQQDMAVKQQNLQFLREKQAFEEQQGLKTEARQTQQQIFTQSYQVAQMQNDIAQFNAKMNFEVQQQNFANGETRANRLQNLATQIGTLAQDAGDRGKYASTVLANSGWGADNSQTDYRTPESLMPLNQLLAIRANSMGGPAPITQERVGMPNLPTPGAGLDLATTLPPVPSTPQLPAPTPTATNPYAQINAIAAQQNATGTNPAMFNVGANATPGGVPLDTNTQPVGYSDAEMLARIMASRAAGSGSGGSFAGGGIAQGAFVAGDAAGEDPSAGGARPELVIPLGNGKTVVLNEKQMAGLGINLKSVDRAATGGIFDAMAYGSPEAASGMPSGTGDAQFFGTGDTSLANDFLAQAAQQQRVNTPWAGGGNLPSPVYGSSPGFDPIVLDLIASMNALERGYPAAAYKRQAALLTPAGIGEHVVRRSA